MTEFEKQREEMRIRAVEALKRTSIDSMGLIGLTAKKAKISPYAFNLSGEIATPEEKLVARVPDLLAIAVWAHYALQDGVK